MTFDKTRYIAIGIPRISTSLANALSQGIPKERTLQLFEIENPQLRELIDYRQSKVEESLDRKLSRGTPIDAITKLVSREFLVEASLVYSGLLSASEGSLGVEPVNVNFSEDSGLPILTEDMGSNAIRIYTGAQKIASSSNEFIDTLKTTNPELFRGLNDLGEIYKQRGERSPLTLEYPEDIKRRAKQLGNLGAEILYDSLRRQNQTYKLEEGFRF